MTEQHSKKEFTYKGNTIEELKKLDVREFAKFTTSRQRRTILRNFQQIEEFVNRSIEKLKNGKRVRTHQRDIVIVPGMVGMTIQVYNGNNFVPVEIIGDMLGHRLGEFSPTRGKVKHGSAGIGATKGTRSKAKK